MIIFVCIFLLLQKCRRSPNFHTGRKQQPQNIKTLITIKSRKKPDWVTQEVLRLKAYLPKASCRTVAYIFNQRFEHKGQTVGKTFVSYTIRNHLYDIDVLRQQMKSRSPYQVAFNRHWGMDITFVNNQPVLGITEHHSRKLLGLIPLRNKSSFNIIKQLIQILRINTKPKFIRTDNEICFNSKLLKLFLKLMGVKHQTTEKHCPWQNGRIERLFGTFKTTIAGLPIEPEELPLLCYDFQQWYNLIRPHQSLNGNTPEEIYWNQINKQYRQ